MELRSSTDKKKKKKSPNFKFSCNPLDPEKKESKCWRFVSVPFESKSAQFALYFEAAEGVWANSITRLVTNEAISSNKVSAAMNSRFVG